jgi:hypothetical protein
MRLSGWSRTLLAVSGTLAAMAVLAPASVEAQQVQGAGRRIRFEFVPFAGVLVPLGKLINEGSVVHVTMSHRTTFLVGGRLDAWFSHLAGAEVAVGYAPSGYHVVQNGSSDDTTGSHLSVSARFVVRFATGPTSTWHLYVGGGIVSHGGAGVGGLRGTTDVSGVAGVAGRFRVTPALALQATAEDYIYQASFGPQGEAGNTQGRINNDLMLSLGLVVPLGGSR